MQAAFLVGVAVAIVSGFFNGAFALPLRYARGWEWENTWLVFSVFSLIVLPWAVAYYFVPHLPAVVSQLPASYFIPGIIAGIFWGLSFVLYGVALNMVGIAVGNAVVASMSTIAGTMGPMIVYAPDKLWSSTGVVLVVAIALMVTGIYTYGKAGNRKEKETQTASATDAPRKGSFRLGLILCLITGPMGTVFIYGINSSKGLVEATKAAGTNPLVVGCVAMALTFSVGFIANLLYCLYRMNQNKTFDRYAAAGNPLLNTGLAFLMAAMWFAGLVLYGAAAVKMGRLGPSIGFGLFVSGTVLFANFLGWRAGEWKGASAQTIHGFLRGMTLVVIAIFVIAFGVH